MEQTISPSRSLANLQSPISTSSTQPYLSVFIPARNEAGNLPLLMEKLARTFRDHALAAEVILVDDGSTDETWKLALAAAEQYPFSVPIAIAGTLA